MSGIASSWNQRPQKHRTSNRSTSLIDEQHRKERTANQFFSSLLGPWRALLPLHFSTWPESAGDTRSDSHAWSAHPIYDLLTLVAGVEPAAPGFARVCIAPHLGGLQTLQARYPHPRGAITMDYHASVSGLDATVTIPDGVPATFVWRGQQKALHAGTNKLQFRAVQSQ